MTIIITHTDHDGHASAAIASLYLKKHRIRHRIHPVNHGDDLPEITRKDDVIMSDFSIPRDAMIEMARTARSFTWIDHHSSAIKDMEGITLDGIRDASLAACELAWLYYFPGTPAPKIITYLGAYDSWRHRDDPDILAVEYCLRSLDTDPRTFDWTPLLKAKSLAPYIEKGTPIYRKELIDAKAQMKSAFTRTLAFNGTTLKAVILNTQTKSSLPFQDALSAHDLAVSYRYDGTKYSNSLYSHASSKTDTGQIAKALGGGGHTHAAGCTTATPIWKTLAP